MENATWYTTDRPAVMDWKKKEKMNRILDIAVAMGWSATETAILVAKLDEVGFEIRPKADGL